MTNKNNLHCLFMNVMPNHLKNDGEDFFYNVKPTTPLKWHYLCSADVSGMCIDEDYIFEQLMSLVTDLSTTNTNQNKTTQTNQTQTITQTTQTTNVLSDRFVFNHLTQKELKLNILNIKGIIAEIMYCIRNSIPYNYYVKQNNKCMYATKHFYKTCKELVSFTYCTTMFVSSRLDLCYGDHKRKMYSLQQLKQLPYSQIVIKQDVYEYLLAKQQ